MKVYIFSLIAIFLIINSGYAHGTTIRQALTVDSAAIKKTAFRKHKKSDPDPSARFIDDGLIYDIVNDIATIKIITNKFKFIDYEQLAKIDGA